MSQDLPELYSFPTYILKKSQKKFGGHYDENFAPHWEKTYPPRKSTFGDAAFILKNELKTIKRTSENKILTIRDPIAEIQSR